MLIIRTLNKYPALQGILALALWATGATTTCFLARIPAFELLAIAFGTTALIVFIITAKQKAWANLKAPWQVWVTVFLGIIFQQFFAVYAFKSCSAAEADIIIYLWPLLAILFARIFLKINPHKRYYVAGGFGLLAVIVMSMTNIQGIHLGAGHAFALLSAVCWSLYTTFARKLSGINFQIIGIAYAIGSILSLISHLSLEQFIIPNKGELLALAQYILIATCAFNLWTNSMQSKKATLLTVSSYGKPLISIMALCLFGFSQPSISIAIAGILISLAGLIAHGGLLKVLNLSIITPLHSLSHCLSKRLITATNATIPYMYKTSLMVLSIAGVTYYCGLAL